MKGYVFLSFAKHIRKNILENISKILSVTDSQKLLDHAKQSATDVFKTALKRAIQIIAEKTDYLTVCFYDVTYACIVNLHSKVRMVKWLTVRLRTK